jgi:hypothetical protein
MCHCGKVFCFFRLVYFCMRLPSLNLHFSALFFKRRRKLNTDQTKISFDFLESRFIKIKPTWPFYSNISDSQIIRQTCVVFSNWIHYDSGTKKFPFSIEFMTICIVTRSFWT